MKPVKQNAGKLALDLHAKAEAHDFSGSPDVIRKIIRNRNCDLGTALLVYWRGDPNFYRLFHDKFEMIGDPSADIATFDIMVEVECKILDGRYQNSRIPFNPFKDGRTNWARQHYNSYAYSEFYCDLPLEVYGLATEKQIRSVRPKSKRPVGLAWIAEQIDDSLGPKTIAAIRVLEKYDKQWGQPVKFVSDAARSVNNGIFVDFEDKVPDRAFAQIKDIPGVTHLNFGSKSTDVALTCLEHAPDLTSLKIHGNITSAGLQQLKHTPKMQTLEIWSKHLDDKAIRCLRHVPQIQSFRSWQSTKQITAKGFATLASLPKLNALFLSGVSLANADLDWIGRSRLCELFLQDSDLSDSQVAPILKLGKRKTFRSLSLHEHRLTDSMVKKLETAFKKRISITPGSVVAKRSQKAIPASKSSNASLNAKKMLDNLFKEVSRATVEPKNGFESHNAILALSPDQFAEMAVYVADLKPLSIAGHNIKNMEKNTILYSLRQAIFRRKIDLTDAQIVTIAAAYFRWDLPGMLTNIERHAKKHQLPGKAITQLKKSLKTCSKKKTAARLKALTS